MASYSREEMRNFIAQFISDEHDYIPKCDIDESNIVGCFNSIYHNDYGQSLIYPPVKETEQVSFLTTTYVYILTKENNIYVLDNELNVYNLDDCLRNSLEMVFSQLRSAYLVKINNE